MPSSPDVPAAVITVSDRCHAGTQEDRSGPLARDLLASEGLVAGDVVVVPDEVDAIQGALRSALEAGARFVLTTGGTGVGPRDVTPEAVAPLLALDLPGVAEQVRAHGLAATPHAVISRGVVGLTDRGERAALVATAPGSTGGVRDTVAVVAPLVRHVLGQAAGAAH
ncbi:MogA/MoaB family molybdenum cofactor biosynthesis protein [Georgenia sp. Z1344]|uniref:MogA/MoaB family molybdenum cofactor biosynthesis protein n=1 Tax=Georgenia sp. Z1344 TaxID=3416706 RepID=UPI003CEE88DC